MRLTFKLRFHTSPGDSLWLVGDHEILGNDDPGNAIPLQYLDANFWQVTLVLPKVAVPNAAIAYHYIWRRANGGVSEDWGAGRTINPSLCRQEERLIIDAWNHPGFFENAFYTEPFREVLLQRNTAVAIEQPVPSRATHIFRVKAPLLAMGETVSLLGNCSAMGNWETRKAVLLGRNPNDDYFSIALDLSGQPFPIQYKYGVFHHERNEFVRFEEGDNRLITDGPTRHREVLVNDGFIVLPANTWRGAGVAIPVFSLRSETSFGVGEFLDLKKLVDWCRQTGLKMIQLLPINDTIATHTWTDSYPYTAISAFALHPIYLHLPMVVEANLRKLLHPFEPERKRLNALDALDYQAVTAAKLGFLEKIYPLQREETFARKEYEEFFARNQEWLVPYAMFCMLRDRYKTPNFDEWPQHRHYDAAELAKFANTDPTAHHELAFHYFIQFHLHAQLKEVADYAHANGVILKGDIPIGVYRHGVDAWQNPELYHMDLQSGAPPDAFAVKGQNWSFPTYNWPKMAQTGFAWWKSRLRQMSNYFDAFRIDHILGFFRIWSIPIDAVEGILGYFDPALPVRPEEFEQRGIRFDRNRFAKPYITEAVLKGVFEEEWQRVRQEFLTVNDHDRLSLKIEFNTQRKVEAYFADLQETEANTRLKLGLYDLISNVILLEGRNTGEFHFRFRIDTTSSFHDFDPKTQATLKKLYLDYFFGRQEQFWENQGFARLPAIKQVTNMLICGEDLGMVPKCVPHVMKQLGILSLEVQRMPKSSKQDFSRPREAAFLSVVTPSTHDMSTIRGWWKEDRAVTQKFFNQELGQPGNAPAECEPWIVKAILGQHLSSPAMWCVFQLQDLLGIDAKLHRPDVEAERINVPANPTHYWRYRMHLTLEQLLGESAYNQELRTCLQQSGR